MGQKYAHVALEVGGEHNVMNALAAASAAYLLGVSGEAVGLGLETLPASLEEAVDVAKGSEFLHKFLPDELSRRYYAEALRRCEALKNAADPIEYERVHYFNAI